MRDAKQADFVTRAAQRINVEGPSGSTATDTINVAVLKNELKEEVDPDMDNPSAQDALDGMLAYYKVENPPQEREQGLACFTPFLLCVFNHYNSLLQPKVSYFSEAVNEQVIERHFRRDLAEDTLSPLVVNVMSPEQIADIAAEATEVTHERERLQAKKKMFAEGQAIFKKTIGFER